MYTLLALLTNILWCQPIEGTWDRNIKAKCYSVDLVIGFALSNSCKPNTGLVGVAGEKHLLTEACHI